MRKVLLRANEEEDRRRSRAGTVIAQLRRARSTRMCAWATWCSTRRRLRAKGAAEARKRADRRARRRQVSTISGELPPILDTFVLEFDKHGALDTTGLAVCTKAKLVATDVASRPAQLARARSSARASAARSSSSPNRGRSGRLADHPLQRPEEGRRRHDHRPRPPRLSRADHLHRPDRDRKDPQGHLRLPRPCEFPRSPTATATPISGSA